MRRLDPQHGPRISALLGGFVAALAVVLSYFVVPAGAADAPVVPERPSAPSVGDGPAVAPDQALHRVTSATSGGAVRIVHPGGFLPVPALSPAARCIGSPADLFSSATAASGVPLRVLFCTWLN